MKNFFMCFLMFYASVAFSQDLRIDNNPYDRADENTESRKPFQREKWFYEQRMYPNNYIDPMAYSNSLNQRDELRKKNGFGMKGIFDTWVSLGPKTGFYFGWANVTSRIASVKYDPVNPNIIYAAGACGGVWKSTDSGLNWFPKSDYEASLASGSIAIDPTNTNIIYYATGEATYSDVSYYGKGLLKSTDGGTTWQNFPQNSPALWYYCSRIVIRPNHSSELLAAMAGAGLFRSTNGGETWTVVNSGRCDDVVFSPTGDTAFAVGNGIGYRKSIDGGASFTASSALTMGERNHISICRAAPNVLYYSKYLNGAITVFKSTNHGMSFTQIAVNQNFNAVQAWYDFYVYVSPYDPNYAYVGSIDIWRTTNGGSTNFVNITNGYSSGNVHVDQHNLDFHPTDPQQMVCVNDGGIWKSTDRGTTWTNQNTNQVLTQFYRIAADPSNASHIIGGTQDNGTQRTTGSMNWTAPFGGDGGEVCFHAKNSSYILGETQNNVIYRSTNGGANFSSSTSGLTGTPAWVGPIISHPDSAGIFYTARQVVFKSTNWGASWVPISTGSTGTIEQMNICKSAPNVMYVSSGSTLFRSTNRGYSFTNVTSGLPTRIITSVYAHPDSPAVAIVTLSGFGAAGINKTTNGGSTWFSISGNLPNTPINDGLIYHPGYSTSRYYVATDVGVFVTDDYGQSWIELADGLPNSVAIHMDYHMVSGKLRVATHGRGVFEIHIPIEPVIDVASVNAGPSGNQNYSSTTINPTGTVKNNGNGNATFTVSRVITPGNYTSTRTISSLAPGATTVVTFDAWTFTSGTTYLVRDSVSIAGDMNSANNTSSSSITPTRVQNATVTLSQGFNLKTFPPVGWAKVIVSGTTSSYWYRKDYGSYGAGKGCSMFKGWKTAVGSNQALVTPAITPTTGTDTLVFDYTYAPKNTGATDSLIIETSVNSGISFVPLHRMWGNNLNGTLNTAPVTSSEYKPLVTHWRTFKLPLTAGINKLRFRAVSGYGNNIYVDSIRVLSYQTSALFEIKAIPQGWINAKLQGIDVQDSIRIYLRENMSPFRIVWSSVAAINQKDNTASFSIGELREGRYYVVVKHRNSLETWSSEGGFELRSGSGNKYDFTADPSFAFRSSLYNVSPGLNCLFSGDVNNDERIDKSDVLQICRDAETFADGFEQCDLNGDSFVDGSDAIIADNNAENLVKIAKPK